MERRIVREERIDDGTTTGRKVYIDSFGDAWEPTHKTKDSCGTADHIVTADGRGVIWEYIN